MPSIDGTTAIEWHRVWPPVIPNTPFMEILRPEPSARARESAADFARLERTRTPLWVAPPGAPREALTRRARVATRFAAVLLALFARGG